MNYRNHSLYLIGVVLFAIISMTSISNFAQGADLQPGPATITRIGNTRSFEIKAEPDRESEAIAGVFDGQSVTVLEVVRTSPTTSWARVTYNDFEGWLPASVLVNENATSAIFELDPVIVQQNIEIGQRVVEEIWGREDTTVENFLDLYAFFDSGIRRHALGETTSFGANQDDFLESFNEIHNTWPNLEVAIRHISATQDTVTVHFTARGTFSNASQPGSFLDRDSVQPTNEQGIWDFVIIERIENGLIVEEWWFWNREVIEHALGADGANN